VHGVPLVLSNTSGAAEVLRRGALKVDYWDTEMMARMITMVLEHPALAGTLRRESAAEIRGLTWDEAARKCIRLYHDAMSNGGRVSRPLQAAVV
jgi:glycosyltransferase involved in cell wall biosynthesis